MKIGYLDYQLKNYHFKKFHGILSGPIGAGHATVDSAWELSPSPEGQEWCRENGVHYHPSAETVIEGSDALMVLAPNNPEKHLEMARPALASGKPVFIDKMLASTTADAKEIVRIAEQHNTPLFSSSSLRFAAELENIAVDGPVDTVFARGLGKLPIYGVHTIALGLRYFGARYDRVIDTGTPGANSVTVRDGGRVLTIDLRESENQYDATPWQVGVLSGNNYQVATITRFDEFYENLMKAALEFIRTGTPPLTTAEMLAVVAIQEAAEQSLAEGGVWVTA